MMGSEIDERLLQEALAFGEDKHGVPIAYDSLFSLVHIIYEKKERMPFVDALRLSLNAQHLYDRKGQPPKRIAYRCAAATYFSLRSALARAARAAGGRKPPKKTRPNKEPTFVLEKGGQFAFEL